MDYRKHLKDLRKKLSNEQMSLLVGSGLSKNVSSKFPDWDELLKDLAYELNKDEVEVAYEQVVARNPSEPPEKDVFIRQHCCQLMRKQGYLEIVSEFIRFKGHRESIATYIEARIPEISKRKGKYYLDYNGSSELVPSDSFRLHKELIDLPWNNIYTTNYDDLLDICVNREQYAKLKNEIYELEKEIQEFDRKIRKIEKEREMLSGPTLEPERKAATDLPQSGVKPDPKVKKKTTEKARSFEEEIRVLTRQRKYREQLISEKEVESNACYQVFKKLRIYV